MSDWTVYSLYRKKGFELEGVPSIPGDTWESTVVFNLDVFGDDSES